MTLQAGEREVRVLLHTEASMMYATIAEGPQMSDMELSLVATAAILQLSAMKGVDPLDVLFNLVSNFHSGHIGGEIQNAPAP